MCPSEMTPTLSLYTYVRNALSLDFHLLPMLRHHLPLVDEVVILEGYSTDGTYEALMELEWPKVKVVREHWDDVEPGPGWWGTLSDRARVHCTGDWCLKLDADEFIPEWELGD